jgi:hypothetical protein
MPHINKYMNEWTNKQMKNERTNEWMNERMTEWVEHMFKMHIDMDTWIYEVVYNFLSGV